MSIGLQSNVRPEPPLPRGRFKRRWRRVLIVSPFVLATLLIMAFFALRWFETAVTFHPAGYLPGPKWELPHNAENVWMKTADGLTLHGWFIKASAPSAIATIIYFHGNGGNLSNVGWVGKSLASHGFDVLLFDYRGYGRSEGEVSDERGLNLDADAAYRYVTDERGALPDHIAFYGSSLGTTTAIDLASRKLCAALVIESGLSSASDLASAMLPWLPHWAHRFGRNRFESAQKLANIHCPILITHGEPDGTIPTEEGRKLYAAANEPKRLIILPGVGHNVVGFGGENYLATVATFLTDALRNPASVAAR